MAVVHVPFPSYVESINSRKIPPLISRADFHSFSTSTYTKMNVRSKFFLGLFAMLVFSACRTPKIPHYAFPVPAPEREFRAAWIATVDNIDWPSKRGLPVDQQKSELVALLDRAQALNMNAIIFQVRPSADALYDSPLEPWSEYLTGQQGKAPEPYYDPLAFVIEEAHKRGLELHAWFNPYRAWHPAAKGTPAPDHISQMHPEWVRTYGVYKWMDPGSPEAAAFSKNVMMDVVKRYDVDGIHMDDYFYPYPISENGREVDFPDAETFANYGNGLSKADWRRQNVNHFVETLYREIKKEKPWVKLGISPFGIWRPGFPPQIKGFDQYDKLYADAKLWLNKGWLDYFTPQLYWPIDKVEQSYPTLLKWWISENTQNRHIWPGNYTSKVIDPDPTKRWDPVELVNQVRMTQDLPGTDGNVHFSMKSLMASNSVLGDRLRQEVYRYKTLVPASPWLGEAPKEKPAVKIRKQKKQRLVELGFELSENSAASTMPLHWIIRTLYGNRWEMELVSGSETVYALKAMHGLQKPDWVVVSALSRTGVEGPQTAKRIKK